MARNGSSVHQSHFGAGALLLVSSEALAELGQQLSACGHG